MIRVLFLCTGNICRSPMAEGIFAHKVEQAGLADHILCDSAGTTSYHAGEAAHAGTLAVLRKHGIVYHGRSRPLEPNDIFDFDYILTMDDSHYSAATRMSQRAGGRPKAQVIRMLDFAPEFGESEVPDPYYDGQFDAVYNMLDAAANRLLAHIRKTHDL